MLSNIEQAIANVFASEQEIILVNIMDAYVRVAGFTHWSADAFVAFEHALDKYPDSAEKADSLLAKVITELRQNYWHQMFGVPKGGDAQYSSCPCCGIMKLMQQTVDDQGHTEEAMQLAGQVPVRSKKSKTKRAKNRRLIRKAIAFDPYGPSTSASSM